ncbi:MAG: hypothetical protein KC776_23550 [Myxococcales bacterium]|nr:hypothetical protein [Myxococcales bacterium]MCB9575981.1 hypothetical protein [Polyangiaceae bacterium]
MTEKLLVVATSVAATLVGWALLARQPPPPRPLPVLVPTAGRASVRTVSPRVHARTRSSR